MTIKPEITFPEVGQLPVGRRFGRSGKSSREQRPGQAGEETLPRRRFCSCQRTQDPHIQLGSLSPAQRIHYQSQKGYGIL